MSTVRVWANALILGVFLCVSLSAHAEVILKGEKWSVAIDPERLGVAGKIVDGSSVVVSSPRPEPVAIADLKNDDKSAAWKLPAEKTSVSMKLDGDALVVDVVADAAGEFTWPVIAADTKPAAYILPLFEGSYVPADDEPWGKFLSDGGELNTTAGLQMPFWGIDIGNGRTLTYIITNPYNNDLAFDFTAGRLGAKLTHAFTRNHSVKQYGLRIQLGDGSPVTPAKIFRKHLHDTGAFVSMKQKIEKTPDAAKLLGAMHAYLWGDNLIGRDDIRDYKKLAAQIVAAGKSEQPSVGKRVWELLNDEVKKLLTDEIPKTEFVEIYQKRLLTEELTRILKLHDFADSTPKDADALAVATENIRVFHAAFKDLLTAPDTWGDAFSPKMVKLLSDAGVDRAWLGSSGWDGLTYHPAFTRAAIEKGYLVGPYDSYHSMHAPGTPESWETAQLGAELFAVGAITRADGTKRPGFKQKGYLVSPAAARPYLEKRVTELAKRFQVNSWFMDCDAFGEVFDDYSPEHPMTQAQDAAERVNRMKWITDTFNVVMGSEMGSAYSAPVIHYSHGIMTPVIAWGDPDLQKNKQSKYYLGPWFPADGPAVFLKQVPMKDEHRHLYVDPRFRIPLYQTVFHDSVVTTHHWSFHSLKFEDPTRTRELLELLYNVPPLYHLNPTEWKKRQPEITRHFAFFSPLHREAGLLPMTDFKWLSEDRMVQQTTFGEGELTMTANFTDKPVQVDGVAVPPHSIAARQGGKTQTYPAR